MIKCPKCRVPMESKGSIGNSLCEESIIVFYQCPKCENVELNTRQFDDKRFRLDYP